MSAKYEPMDKKDWQEAADRYGNKRGLEALEFGYNTAPKTPAGGGKDRTHGGLQAALGATGALPSEIISQEDLGVMGANLQKQHAAGAKQAMAGVAARLGGDTGNPAFAAMAGRIGAGATSSAANALAGLKIEATAMNVEQAMRRQSLLNSLAGVSAQYDLAKRGVEQGDRGLDQRDIQLGQAEKGLALQKELAEMQALVSAMSALKGAQVGSPGFSAAVDAMQGLGLSTGGWTSYGTRARARGVRTIYD